MRLLDHGCEDEMAGAGRYQEEGPFKSISELDWDFVLGV
jgi:hypothetical protein